MSRYKAYPEYRDSGVEWLGEVPAHWNIQKVAWRFFAKKGANAAQLTKEFCASIAGEHPVFSGQTENSGVMACIDSYEFDAGEEGYLFSTTVGAKAMTVMHIAGKFSLSQNCMVIIPYTESSIARFYYYHFQPLFSHERGLIPEHMQASFRMEDLYQYKVIEPQKSEQQKIAEFLDHETAKIDALIEKQQRLIELLKEKRQAVISHAITKGLNPNAPMKDSGVEWLGEVPAHWNMQKLAWRFTAKKGSNAAQLTKEFCASIEGQHPVYSGQTENSGVMACIDSYEFDAGEEGYLFSTTVGAKAMTVMHITGRFSLSQNCMVIIPCTAYSIPRFYYYHFQPLFSYERGLIPEHMQASFRMEDLYQYKVLEPPKSEQIEIANFLDVNTAVFDDLISRSLNACLLLQERRTALISAAVTGKIDVRDWQAAA